MRLFTLITLFCIITIAKGKECQPKALFISNDYWEIILQNLSPNPQNDIYLYYFGYEGDRLARIDSKGNLIYTLNLNHDYLFPTPIQSNGIIYIPKSSQRAISLINSRTGEFENTINILDPDVNITSTTGFCDDIVYGIGTIKGEYYVIGINSTGSVVWISSNHVMEYIQDSNEMPIVIEGCSSLLYVVDPYDNNANVMFNRESLVIEKKILWSVNLNITRTYALLSGDWTYTLDKDLSSIALLWTSGSFQRPPNFHLYVIDLVKGSFLYQQVGGGYQYKYSSSNPIYSFDSSSLYFAPEDIFAISLNPDGALKWYLSTNDTQPWSYPHSGALSYNGKVLYYTLRFSVVAIDTDSHEVLWTSPTVWDPEPNYSTELQFIRIGGNGYVVGLGLKNIWDYSSCEQ